VSSFLLYVKNLRCRLVLCGKLHTLEDYPAHSNFCELCLVSMGYTDVFTHVGEAVRIQAPDGRMVAPVVTGRSFLWTISSSVSKRVDGTGVFGADDFMHSLFAGQLRYSVPTSRAKVSSSQRGLTASYVEPRAD